MSQTISMPPPPPLRNDDQVLEHYADGPVGVEFLSGNLHITFATLRADHAQDPAVRYRQVTLRMVLPLAGAIDLQNQIAGILTLLQQQGLIQPIMPGPQTRQ
jgi:hypothetical protein